MAGGKIRGNSNERLKAVPLFYLVLASFNVALILVRNATTTLTTLDDLSKVVPDPPQSNRSTEVIDVTDFSQEVNQQRNQQRYEACFVTSVFAPSPELGDRPPSVEDMKKAYPGVFAYFAFTNLPNLEAPGWTLVIRNDLMKYRRYITQSRHAKFLAWRDATIQQACQAVFYMDGFCQPKEKNGQLYRSLASTIATNSTFGLAQNRHLHTSGVMHELDRIVKKKKDIAENVEATIKWLRGQPDFRENCTMYENHYIAYNPKSVHFQKASTFFWDHYSLEQDSWRDQPLWCYVLDKFHITPTPLGDPKKLFWERWRHMAKDGHRYDKAKDNDARQKQVPKV